MQSRPSKAAEFLVAIFVPPACREEVVGDLHERYRSPLHYALETIRTVPMVVLSRIRRTADPQILLMQAFAFYLSFLCFAWFHGGALLRDRWGLLRLAIPGAMMLLGLVLEDAYARPGPRPPLGLMRGPVLGLGLSILSQELLRAGNPDLALPGWIMVYGCAASLLLSSTIRLSFPPPANQLQGAHAPAEWLKRAGDSPGMARRTYRIAAVFAAFVLLVIAYRLFR